MNRTRRFRLLRGSLVLALGLELLVPWSRPAAEAATAPGVQVTVDPRGVVGLANAVPATVTVTLGATSVAVNGNPPVVLNDFGRYSTGKVPIAGAHCGTNDLSILYVGRAVGATTYEVLCPVIGLSPSSAGVPDLPTTVVVTSRYFDYQGDDQYKYLTVDGAPAGRFTYGNDPSFTMTGGCGQHQVQLAQASQYGPLVATAVFTVVCPKLAVAPGAILRSSQPRAVTLTGTGFDPSAAVALSVEGASIGSAIADAAGNFSATPTIGGLSCATHQIVAAETAPSSVVPSPSPGPSGSPAPPLPPPALGATRTAQVGLAVRCPATLAISPTVIPGGMTTHVTGGGFAPHAQVTLVWQLDGGLSRPVPGSPVTADATGAIDFYTLMMVHEPVGARTLVAKDATSSAAATGIVEGGTMQPGGSSSNFDFIFRR
jgi:hypothetical protein